ERAGVWHHPTTSILEPFLLVRRHLGTVLVVVLACVAVGAMAGPAAAAPGDLDTTFAGGTGTAFFDPAVGTDIGYGAALQSDGKVLLFGMAGTGNFGLVRLKANGTPDPTFGGGDATVTTDFGGTDRALAAAVTPSGRRVLAG